MARLSNRRQIESQIPTQERIDISASVERKNGEFFDSELVIGLVAAVGTSLSLVAKSLEDRLKDHFAYQVDQIHIAKEIIPQLPLHCAKPTGEYGRVDALMSAGTGSRQRAQDNSLLALGAVCMIGSKRNPNNTDNPEYRKRQAYIINSLKHPSEVERLREIYGDGFFLVGVYSDENRRLNNLTGDDNALMSSSEAKHLMERDDDEQLDYGQRTRDTFHQSDFFIHLENDIDKTQNYVGRVLDLIFGHPYMTPTFDEYAMFMAYSSSLRSSDLSRQVGAVIAINDEIIASGANDAPRFGGGLYWAFYKNNGVSDHPTGRDFKRGIDANQQEKQKIIDDIMARIEGIDTDRDVVEAVLQKSGIADIMEYGRSVHAEMEALMSCARNTVSARGGTLYCTTFPCHNCAKHIVAAGIKRVVYVEPYPKSKAAELHSDSIHLGFRNKSTKQTVFFEPFVGVGPRRFVDLFSMNFGSGYPITRKDKSTGKTRKWSRKSARLRMRLSPFSYIEQETDAARRFGENLLDKGE